MTRTWTDRLRTWAAGIPWRATMWMAYRRQTRERRRQAAARRRFQQDY